MISTPNIDVSLTAFKVPKTHRSVATLPLTPLEKSLVWMFFKNMGCVV